MGWRGISHFSLDHLVDVFDREVRTTPMHYSAHCWEAQSLKMYYINNLKNYLNSAKDMIFCAMHGLSSFGLWAWRSFVLPCSVQYSLMMFTAMSLLLLSAFCLPSLLPLVSCSLWQLADLYCFLLLLMWRVWGQLMFGYRMGITNSSVKTNFKTNW